VPSVRADTAYEKKIWIRDRGRKLDRSGQNAQTQHWEELATKVHHCRKYPKMVFVDQRDIPHFPVENLSNGTIV
jgi:hypothetical protein